MRWGSLSFRLEAVLVEGACQWNFQTEQLQARNSSKARDLQAWPGIFTCSSSQPETQAQPGIFKRGQGFSKGVAPSWKLKHSQGFSSKATLELWGKLSNIQPESQAGPVTFKDFHTKPLWSLVGNFRTSSRNLKQGQGFSSQRGIFKHICFNPETQFSFLASLKSCVHFQT
jgi:hypothetical protein